MERKEFKKFNEEDKDFHYSLSIKKTTKKKGVKDFNKKNRFPRFSVSVKEETRIKSNASKKRDIIFGLVCFVIGLLIYFL